MVEIVKGKMLLGPILAIIGSILLLIGGIVYFYFNTYMSIVSYLVGNLGYTTNKAVVYITILSIIMYCTVTLGILGAIITATGRKFGSYLVIFGGIIAIFQFTIYSILSPVISPNLLLQLYPWNFFIWGGQLMILIGGILGRKSRE
ncbi:MAG: hypothetical protein ACXAEX_20965 [Promethearchaeota archaeon]|jgi:hypothetical protein